MLSTIRRTPGLALFLSSSLALSLLALAETYLSRWPGRERLFYPMFDRLFAFTDNWGAALEALVVVLVAAVPWLRRRGAQLAETLGEHPLWTAGSAFALLALGARFVYHATPLAMDEYTQLSQAYAFAHGELSWTVPPDLLDRMVPKGFRNYFFAVDSSSGVVASQYWPGFAGLLAPFAWAGLPWLLNPALTAASLLLLHAICVRLLGSRVAGGWAMLFALGSVQFTINGISYYSMPAHLALNLLFAWLLLDGRPLRAFLAGLVGGLALNLHNPVPHALFAIPWLLWLVWTRRPAALFALLAGYVPTGLVVGIAWALFIGAINPAPTGVPSPSGAGGALITGFRIITGILQLPTFPLVCARLYATWKIWIWSCPGLMLLSLAGCRVVRGPILLFGASAATTYLLYWLVPVDQGHGWGYRYFFTAWAALPLLGAACIVARPAGDPAGDSWREWAGGLALASMVLSTGLRLFQVEAIVTEHVAQRIPMPPAGKWIVFVTARTGLYTWDMIQNLPGDKDRLVLMSYGSRKDAALVASHFPGAQRTLIDARGSLWSLQGEGPN